MKPGRRGRPAGMGRSAEAAWEAVVALGLGMGLGYWLDSRFGTAPWLFLAFLGLGLATGFQRLMRGLRRDAPAGDAEPGREGDPGGPGETRR